MRKVAEDWQGELLEGRVVADDRLQKRNRTGRCCFSLAGLAEAAQVEESVDGVVLNLLRRGEVSAASDMHERERLTAPTRPR